jgi:hypothetical protein
MPPATRGGFSNKNWMQLPFSFTFCFKTEAEGARGGKRVSIHVQMFNPALALYECLGFRKRREVGVYHFMEWSPESSV